jgi:hypothetical protein
MPSWVSGAPSITPFVDVFRLLEKPHFAFDFAFFSVVVSALQNQV